MQVAFILSMPGNNSWNGKWSGDGRCYAVIKSFRGKAEKRIRDMIALKSSYGYDFGDGWYASVQLGIVDAKKARQLRKDSKGFYGYEWMIESILRYGKIFASHQEEQRKAWVEAQKLPAFASTEKKLEAVCANDEF